MEQSLVMQGRSLGPAELAQVRGLLAAHPDWSRYRLSRDLCRVWNWRSLTGQIKDMAARALLLKLEQRGWVALPARLRPAPEFLWSFSGPHPRSTRGIALLAGHFSPLQTRPSRLPTPIYWLATPGTVATH